MTLHRSATGSMDCQALSPAIARLAVLLAPLAGGPVPDDRRCDDAILRLALRHETGAALHGAAIRNGYVADAGMMRLLEQRYAGSRKKQDAARQRLERIHAAFAPGGISWLAMKGVTQADQLHEDPAWRESTDIDILVSPRDFWPALSALLDAGYIASNPPLPPLRALYRPLFGAVRDVVLVAPDDPTVTVELHRRLFLPGGRRMRALRLNRDGDGLPGAKPDGDLALYLLAHGALGFWVRLKWLFDLPPLLAKLDETALLALPAKARRAGIEKSVAASLLLLRLLFPFVRTEPLLPWLEEKEGDNGVRQRLARYTAMISRKTDWKASPLNNARLAIRAQVSLFEAPSTRAHLMVAAPLSGASRRLAAWLNPGDRGRTWSDAPPPYLEVCR